MSRDYDIIIIGTGPAGFSSAMQSSKFGKEVLVVESHKKYLGGTWINTGTVPSKALREAAKNILDFNEQFGDHEHKKPYERFQMDDLLQYKQEILEKENQKVKNDLIKNKVDVARGFGRLKGKHTVEVETHIGSTETYTADYILVSTGSSPIPPTNFEVDNDKVLDYKSILEITHIPRRLVVIGSGVNAIEYATIFAALGTRVTLLSDKKDYLTFLDHEIKEHLQNSLRKKGITIKKNVRVEDVSFSALRNFTEVKFRSKSEDKRLQVVETEHVLFLGGRKPNIDGLNLDTVGIKTDDRNFIETDDSFKTNVDNIYAAGDVIGFPRLASASFSQGRLAACNMFGIPALEVPDQIPYGIYAIPEISNIGITEQDAEEMGLDVTVGRAYFKNIAKGNMSNNSEGLLKLVFSTNSLKLLGVHILGADAANLIHLGQSVMSYGGDVRYFINHVMNYPTMSEAYRIAAFNGVNRVHKAGVKYKNILEDKSEE
ncbi:Si-specific NAD(P)(+) transhydrogenase [Aliifodinibius salipaludis]|uniref:Soluble pyridine nucleotide transhydrogenase n=1 Tax=Fodinibius salipaludis TaxID=2032627 RepID=A0A2A2GBV2_9BACT|nr:Si-specific NAD(P)(+) transhydrogenase [Aliifodinibius salipaludis]PAU94357.1 Si-specific NAD(P)(+) transhydrogenase [Aliifodinibius salipaludis]